MSINPLSKNMGSLSASRNDNRFKQKIVLDEEENEEEEEEEEGNVQAIKQLSLQALRYVPRPPTLPNWIPERRTTKIPVLKRRRGPLIADAVRSATKILKSVDKLPSQPSAPESNADMPDSASISIASAPSARFTSVMASSTKDVTQTLNSNIITPKSPSLWISPTGKPITPPPIMVLRRTRKDAATYSSSLKQSFAREFGCLASFEKTKRDQLQLENRLMTKTGKSREVLILRRKQLLPKLGLGGDEKTRVRMERTETPDSFTGPCLFKEAERLAKSKDGLLYTMSRKERGFKIVPEWIGCPEVTDEMRTMLHGTHNARDRGNLFTEEPETKYEGTDFVPKFPALGVVGLRYEDVHRCIKMHNEEALKKQPVKESMLVIENQKQNISSQFFLSKSTVTTSRYAFDDSPSEGEVSLTLGGMRFYWSEDSESSGNVHVIELGCTAEIGLNCVSSVTMTNTGTTVIHFNWLKIPPTDALNLQKYNLTRFVFDSWGGTILPGETFRVPFLYKCIESGFYSEDWRLLTKPVLENGAQIVLRLWGITRQYDPYYRERQRIDEALQSRISQAIVRHRVDKIIDYLPIKEVPLKDTRFPLVHLGQELFHFNNRWLQYHCAEVYRLGKIHELLEERQKRKSILPLTVTKVTPDSYVSLDSPEDESTLEISVSRPVFSATTTLTDMDLEITTEGESPNEFVEDVRDNIDLKSSLSGLTVSLNTWENIRCIRRVLLKNISPDLASLKEVGYITVIGEKNSPPTVQDTEEMTSEANLVTEHKDITYPRAPINLTNVDFDVREMRNAILMGISDRPDFQEALFLVMSEQVSRLLFRTDYPLDNWKVPMVRGLLNTAIDSFSQFAINLRLICCESQIRGEHQKLRMAKEECSSLSFFETEMTNNPRSQKEEHSSISFFDTEMTNNARIQREEAPSVTSETLDNEDESEQQFRTTMEVCPYTNPRIALEFTRFQDQYYARLHTKMYEILVDFIESMDGLLWQGDKGTRLDFSRIGFTAIRDVPMNISIDGVLNAPLPPKWVSIAQRMEDTRKMNRSRKLAVEQGVSLAEILEREEAKEKEREKEKEKERERAALAPDKASEQLADTLKSADGTKGENGGENVS